MKIYVVVDYDAAVEIYGVYTDLEKAKKVNEAVKKKDRGHGALIEEFELDEIPVALLEYLPQEGKR